MHPELFSYILKDLLNQHLDASMGRTPGSSRIRRPTPSRRR
ncbi:MAG: hypothetical protein QOD72_2035 [Acidimicrobiaceae bacterium]|jgi:hypothetical protein|nr:hypothetical protein [Acidimicrobiaceae bacterium]